MINLNHFLHVLFFYHCYKMGYYILPSTVFDCFPFCILIYFYTHFFLMLIAYRYGYLFEKGGAVVWNIYLCILGYIGLFCFLYGLSMSLVKLNVISKNFISFLLFFYISILNHNYFRIVIVSVLVMSIKLSVQFLKINRPASLYMFLLIIVTSYYVNS